MNNNSNFGFLAALSCGILAVIAFAGVGIHNDMKRTASKIEYFSIACANSHQNLFFAPQVKDYTYDGNTVSFTVMSGAKGSYTIPADVVCVVDATTTEELNDVSGTPRKNPPVLPIRSGE